MTTEVLNGGAPASPSESANPEAAQANAAPQNPQTDGGEGETTSPAQEKTFTQKELDEILQKRLAKERRQSDVQFRRAMQMAQAMVPQPQSTQQTGREDGKPARSQFATEDEWLDARDAWRDRQRETQQRVESQRQVTSKVWKEASAIPGFSEDAFTDLAETIPPPQMAALVASVIELDASAKVLAHLTLNPEEAQRIAALPQTKRDAELGKLEARLPTVPKTSKTPPPIGDPTARGSTTTVPSDPGKMTHEQYRAWRKAQGARWAQ